jgi:hypothetical protein
VIKFQVKFQNSSSFSTSFHPLNFRVGEYTLHSQHPVSVGLRFRKVYSSDFSPYVYRIFHTYVSELGRRTRHPDKLPGETWKNYLNRLELVYLGMGNPDKITSQQRVAHMLGGLRGRAAKFLEIKPELINMSPQEVSAIMEKRFCQASIKDLLDLNTIRQKPGESVLEYAARLRRAHKRRS